MQGFFLFLQSDSFKLPVSSFHGFLTPVSNRKRHYFGFGEVGMVSILASVPGQDLPCGRAEMTLAFIGAADLVPAALRLQA